MRLVARWMDYPGQRNSAVLLYKLGNATLKRRRAGVHGIMVLRAGRDGKPI